MSAGDAQLNPAAAGGPSEAGGTGGGSPPSATGLAAAVELPHHRTRQGPKGPKGCRRSSTAPGSRCSAGSARHGRGQGRSPSETLQEMLLREGSPIQPNKVSQGPHG